MPTALTMDPGAMPAGLVHAGWAALVLLAALAIDHRWGEPPTAMHPVVWMGRYLQACGQRTVRRPPAQAFILGALAWWLGAMAAAAIAWGLQLLALGCWSRAVRGLSAATGPGGWTNALDGMAGIVLLALAAWLLKSMLSWRMLRDEAGAVEAALGQSLAAGRERLSWLVSRDTAQLTAAEVRESAIETLAENLNDSVVAPIFWFALLGLPGAAMYRFANTADAMWGYRGSYKGVYWEWAGKWAARADDVLSWLPARLTALLLAGVAGGLPLSILRREAGKTPSPNSGWPMAAMSLVLGVRLGKPGVYTLNSRGRLAGPLDLAAAQIYASKVVLATVFSALLAMLLIVAARS